MRKEHRIKIACLIFLSLIFTTGYSLKKIINYYPSKEQGEEVRLQTEEVMLLELERKNKTKLPVQVIMKGLSLKSQFPFQKNKIIRCKKIYIPNIVWGMREYTGKIIGDNSNLLYTKPWVEKKSSEGFDFLCDKENMPNSLDINSQENIRLSKKSVFEVWKMRLENQVVVFCQPVQVYDWVWKIRALIGFNNKLDDSKGLNTRRIENQQLLLCFKAE